MLIIFGKHFLFQTYMTEDIYDGEQSKSPRPDRIPKEIIDKYFQDEIDETSHSPITISFADKDQPTEEKELDEAVETLFSTEFHWQSTGYEDDDIEEEDLDMHGLKPIYPSYFKQTYPKDLDIDIVNLLKEAEVLNIPDEHKSVQFSNSSKVLTINQLKTVFTTYGWLNILDKSIGASDFVFTKNHYIAYVTSKIKINNLVIDFESDDNKVIFYNGKILAHCELEQQVINVLDIIGK